jgi:hypothetical protein
VVLGQVLGKLLGAELGKMLVKCLDCTWKSSRLELGKVLANAVISTGGVL